MRVFEDDISILKQKVLTIYFKCVVSFTLLPPHKFSSLLPTSWIFFYLCLHFYFGHTSWLHFFLQIVFSTKILQQFLFLFIFLISWNFIDFIMALFCLCSFFLNQFTNSLIYFSDSEQLPSVTVRNI